MSYSSDVSDTHVNKPMLPVTQQKRGAQLWIHTYGIMKIDLLRTNSDIDCIMLCVCAHAHTCISSCVKVHTVRYRDQSEDSSTLSFEIRSFTGTRDSLIMQDWQANVSKVSSYLNFPRAGITSM